MKYLIFGLTEKKGNKFQIVCDNLDREDVTEKEKAVGKLLESQIQVLLDYLKQVGIIKIIYTKEIK
jgi:hypothetical protein